LPSTAEAPARPGRASSTTAAARRPRDRGAPIRRAPRGCGRHRSGSDRSDAGERARQRRRDRAGLPQDAVAPYQLVVANILAAPLKLLAPVLSALVDVDGQLVLSGVLARQADELRSAYAPWLDLDVAAEDDGWILLVGTRSGARRMA
jgi:hypothetical protein